MTRMAIMVTMTIMIAMVIMMAIAIMMATMMAITMAIMAITGNPMARAGQGAVDERTPAKMKTGPRGEVTQSFNGVGDAAQAG